MPRIAYSLLFCLLALSAKAGGGRLPLTGGATQLEGAAGGGLAPWALIAGYGTQDEIASTAFITRVHTPGFWLLSGGASVGIHDQLELSLARQRFDLGSTVPGKQLRQDIFGLKWKLYGDAIANQDQAWPQVAVGLMAKHNLDFASVPQALGAKHGSDVEPYIVATKIWLNGIAGRTTLLNGTLRYTRANQLGILGFGGDRRDNRQLRFEGSAAVLLTDRLAAGVEYRKKPDNLSVFKEQRFTDAFLAWAPNQQISVTIAQTDLGNIADKADQHGPYISLKLDF